ncbi:MAG: prolyl oligopeptidase family serine peptidase [Alphaproteobacteria bacterium]|nr:prolyl oligopeptidase family serine peptidase [Alphaproteobacteria bacterium]
MRVLIVLLLLLCGVLAYVYNDVLVVIYEDIQQDFQKDVIVPSKTVTPYIPPSRYSLRYQESDEGQLKGQIIASGETRGFNAYIPDQAQHEKRPAVFLFHGGSRTGASMIERWQQASDKAGIILIAPHGKNGNWDPSIDLDMIPILYQHVLSKYNIDPNRVYLFGHSNGGQMVTRVLFYHPELFAAASIHAGALHPETYRAKKYPMPKNAKKRPIVLINGTDDELFSETVTQKSAEALVRAGYPAELIWFQSHNHWYYDIAAQINAEAWNFMRHFRVNSLEQKNLH